MNLKQHADASGEIRRAAQCAREIATNLDALNSGPAWDRDRDEKIEKIDAWLKVIAEVLVYKVEAA